MRLRQINSVLLPSRIFALIVLLILQTLPLTIQAQQEARIFVLPVASVSGLYQINVEQILRENYGLKLQTIAETRSFRWYFHSGSLPFGLRITPTGNIVGRPRSARPEPYKFKAKIFDTTAGSDELVLMFELKVEPSRIQLVGANAPKLVPVSDEPVSRNDNAGATIFFGNRIAPLWNANHLRSGASSEERSVQLAESTRDSIDRSRRMERSSASDSPAGADVSFLAAKNTLAASSMPATEAAAVVDTSCPGCGPKRDEKKDFIIDARDGSVSGRRKFGLREDARIIIINKNPFLYKYKVSFKDRPVKEDAIAGFFEKWSLFEGSFKATEAQPKSTPGAEGVPGQPGACHLRQEFDLRTIDDLHKDLRDKAKKLEVSFNQLKDDYQHVVEKVEGDEKVIHNSEATCEDLCDHAMSMRAKLAEYKPNLELVSKPIDIFKAEAALLQSKVEELEELARTRPPCAGEIQDLKALAAGYVQAGNELDTGLQKIAAGKKAFDQAVAAIHEVFSHPDAFYKIYTRGEYNLPTDVEITVERKELKDDAAFVKIVDAETINFGGGPRFAIAGGVVISPFETINFKRVPALINGQQTTIVGKDESSNSRILPILMLHGRLWEGSSTVSGVHFSLGVTAKPTDSGTNVEFLLGPSVSFIEERLFFTFGGYAGKRKQLEGNLVPGQELPKEFTDDIPTSNHLVWKPGFALTYKFK